MADGFFIATDERRRATRFQRQPEDDYAAIWLAGEEPHLVEVHDESLGGLGLLLETSCGIGLGSTVNIVYAGSYFVGQARHIEPRSDGRLLIGFFCEPMSGVDF